MDLEIYNGILRERGIDPMTYDTTKRRKYPNGERVFRHDIFKGKTIWINNKKQDFKLFLSSYHPLLGVFFSCKHHPYTKRKRIITLLLMLCVGSLFASISAVLSVFGDEVDYPVLAIYIYKFIVSMMNGVILFTLEFCLRHVLSCSCRENIKNGCCNCLCKTITKCTVCCWCCIASLALTSMILIVLIFQCLTQFITIFILQFLISWLLQVGGLYLKFRKGWKKDMKIMEKLKEAQNTGTKFKCPYLITYEDSNEWIQAHSEYGKRTRGNLSELEMPLVSGSTDVNVWDRVNKWDILGELSEEETD